MQMAINDTGASAGEVELTERGAYLDSLLEYTTVKLCSGGCFATIFKGQ